jgi:diguanylate cyclase (GGDEF)-like protein/PAS domain S-box-containing protein
MLAQSIAFADKPKAITVVLDDNYPPYIFRDQAGHIQGILKDRWALWESRTGIPVNLVATEWSRAQEIMKAGGADVIDTIFVTEERKRIYDFSPLSASIDVPIYFQKDIGGISGPQSLHGFQIAAKEGDSCIDKLHEYGLDRVVPYPSYEAIIKAAEAGKAAIFCMDKPSATYLLYQAHLESEYRYTAPLYTGGVHWAVLKGNQALTFMVQSGFDRISEAELRAIDEKWLGKAIEDERRDYLIVVGYSLLGAIVFGVMLTAWSLTLRRQVRIRTAELSTAFDAVGKAQRETEKTLDHLTATLDAIPDLMFELDEDGRYLALHASRPELLAAPPEALLGRTVREVLPEDAAKEVLNATREAAMHGSAYGYEICLSLPTGQRWFELSAARMRFQPGEKQRFIMLSRDITERKEAEAEIQRLAYFDYLTHLPNRRLLLERLHVAISSTSRHRRHGALLFIDLDDFKTLNDTRGHKVGDLLLVDAAQRLLACVRTEDCVARLGGDEFLVMLGELSSDAVEAAAQAEIVGEKILNQLRMPYSLDGRDHHFTASIGICLFNGEDDSEDELLKRADAAMYRAKKAGRNGFRFFDPAMQASLESRAALESDLRRALPEQQFELYFQPQVDRSNKAMAAEVLLRWKHPERGMVSPLQFITLAEETGLIVPIGAWVLETACAQLKRWEANPVTAALRLSVNVSARQFHQPDFIQQVTSLVRHSGIDPTRLKLELTESVVLDNVADTIEKMHALRAIGVCFSMDDFGTGYSSLSYLKRLPLDELKIDQSFVRDIVTDPSDAVIVQTIIGMARNLGLEVIAEGVETEEQRSFLSRHGCDTCQGYLFSRPVPLPDFEALLH